MKWEDEQCTPHGYTVTLKDNGPGVPQFILEQINSGNSISYGKSKYGGNGLGLSHSKITIREIGGHLEISSDPEEGTKVELLFPRKGEARLHRNSVFRSIK